MDTDYWQQRWREGRTGWHRGEVMPLLAKHWSALNVPLGERVLVPLCGKSLDMLWLASQGLHVLGVEVSPLAIDNFFAENGLTPQTREVDGCMHYRSDEIEIIRADIFDLDKSVFADCGVIYDRAALIALPAPMRTRYAREIYGALPAGCKGLLITLTYPQHEMEGPPFSADESEVQRLFADDWHIDALENRDILADQPTFADQGVTALSTGIYRLQRRACR